MPPPFPMSARPESDVARDLVRRGLWAAPVVVAACGAAWGVGGAVSSAYALALVLVNFSIAAAIMRWSARISLGALMAGVMFGYVIRLAFITGAVLAVTGFDWFEPVPLGLTLVVSHIGLLLWETRYVSANLAHPGLRPASKESS